MNILHISSVKSWGGGEKNIEELCAEFSNIYPEVKNIVLCVKNGLFHKRLIDNDIHFETAPLAFKMDIRFSFRIIAICRKYKIDLIHIHDPSAIQLTILADKLCNLPPFVFNKKTSFPIKNRKSTLYKYNYPKIKKVFCVSEETKRITSEAINNEKLVTIYNGIDIKNRDEKADFLLREKFNIDSSKKIIGIIGNHIRAKNLETLIQVVDIIVNKKKIKDFYFVQIGLFTDRTPTLLESIEMLNLGEYISFTDYVPNASAFIPQFDALLITSQSEGLPLVIYESFYYRVPVISTDVGGIPEAIENNINGLLSPKHNPEKLAEQVIYLFSNTDVIKSFTDISYKKLVEKFTTTIMVKKTLSEYKNILEENEN